MHRYQCSVLEDIRCSFANACLRDEACRDGIHVDVLDGSLEVSLPSYVPIPMLALPDRREGLIRFVTRLFTNVSSGWHLYRPNKKLP